MMVPPSIVSDVEAIRAEGREVELLEDGSSIFGVLVKGCPLASGIWNRDKTDVLILATAGHPNAKLDMFWVPPGLRLANGRDPNAGTHMEMRFGRLWQRFSWHIKQWNPGRDTIVTYLHETVEHRLGMVE